MGNSCGSYRVILLTYMLSSVFACSNNPPKNANDFLGVFPVAGTAGGEFSGVALKKCNPQTDVGPTAVKASFGEYPKAFFGSNITGFVRIEFLVRKDGRVKLAKILEATHPEFASSAIESVINWRFLPAIHNGVPISGTCKIKKNI